MRCRTNTANVHFTCLPGSFKGKSPSWRAGSLPTQGRGRCRCWKVLCAGLTSLVLQRAMMLANIDTPILQLGIAYFIPNSRADAIHFYASNLKYLYSAEIEQTLRCFRDGSLVVIELSPLASSTTTIQTRSVPSISENSRYFQQRPEAGSTIG